MHLNIFIISTKLPLHYLKNNVLFDEQFYYVDDHLRLNKYNYKKTFYEFKHFLTFLH